jgi:hypothetical protein
MSQRNIKQQKMTKPRFVYFGGEPLGVPVLEELKKTDLLPELIVCSPDRPVGRKQILTAPPVKIWAEANNIEVFQPESYKGEAGEAAKQSFCRLTARSGTSLSWSPTTLSYPSGFSIFQKKA